MAQTWQLQEAKNKFSQVVNLALSEGPQHITRRGKNVVVVLSAETYDELVHPRPALVDLLLESPLAGSGIEITRDASDTGREIEL